MLKCKPFVKCFLNSSSQWHEKWADKVMKVFPSSLWDKVKIGFVLFLKPVGFLTELNSSSFCFPLSLSAARMLSASFTSSLPLWTWSLWSSSADCREISTVHYNKLLIVQVLTVGRVWSFQTMRLKTTILSSSHTGFTCCHFVLNQWKLWISTLTDSQSCSWPPDPVSCIWVIWSQLCFYHTAPHWGCKTFHGN